MAAMTITVNSQMSRLALRATGLLGDGSQGWRVSCIPSRTRSRVWGHASSSARASSLRWVVERTIGWLMQHRRLIRDYEAGPHNSASMITIAMIDNLARRLTDETTQPDGTPIPHNITIC